MWGEDATPPYSPCRKGCSKSLPVCQASEGWSTCNSRVTGLMDTFYCHSFLPLFHHSHIGCAPHPHLLLCASQGKKSLLHTWAPRGLQLCPPSPAISSSSGSSGPNSCPFWGRRNGCRTQKLPHHCLFPTGRAWTSVQGSRRPLPWPGSSILVWQLQGLAAQPQGGATSCPSV